MKDICIRVNGINIQVREYEHPGEAIIFLHFGGSNLMMWQRALPFFEGRYHLVMVDIRGHGQSNCPDGGYHMDEMASDIAGVMKHLALDKAHVIGSSLGAEVGLGLAANYPNLVTSLVCEGALSSEFGPYSSWQGTLEEFEAHVEEQLANIRNTPLAVFESVDAFAADRQKAYEGWGMWNEYFDTMIRNGVREVEPGKFAKSMSKTASECYMKNYFHARFEDYYRRITCPILMIPDEEVWGNEAEKTAMMGLKELAPLAQVARVNGWSHPFGWLLDPKEISQKVLEFLSGG